MAQLGYNFDAATAPKDDRNFDPMPDGWYGAQIIESDVQPTRAGDGTIATFTWEIMEGPFARRRVWERINVQNPNAIAQEIGQKTLRSICDAVSVGRIEDTEALHFKPCQIRVGRQKDDRERNEVKSHRTLNGSVQSAPANQSSVPQQQRQAAGGGRPWQR